MLIQVRIVRKPGDKHTLIGKVIDNAVYTDRKWLAETAIWAWSKGYIVESSPC
jgi:hypothetical protein